MGKHGSPFLSCSSVDFEIAVCFEFIVGTAMAVVGLVACRAYAVKKNSSG